MKDEIKEILDFDFESQGGRIEINEYERDILKDYIINLQDKVEWYENIEINKTIDKFRLEHNKEIKRLKEENEKLKEENKHIFAKVNDDELLISNAMNYAEAQDYKSRIEKAIDNINITIEIIKQQPTEDDTWILDRLNGFKYLLQGVDKDE